MSPARRRKQFLKRRSVKKSPKSGWFKLFFLIFLVLAVSFWLSLIGKKGDGKINLVVTSPDGKVNAIAFDPALNEVTNVMIPPQTQVSVARELGTWGLSSVGQLGINEGLEGKLLQETVIKNFHFPINSWAGETALGFIGGSWPGIIKAVLVPYKTNLTLSDRLKIAHIVLKAKNTKRVDVDLANTQMLTSGRLTDGNQGFVVTGDIPDSLIVVFSDTDIAKEGPSVIVRDATGDPTSLGGISPTLEVLGAKIAARVPEDATDIDCVVSAINKDYATKLADVFGCSKSKEAPTGSFDLELLIGREFARRF